MNVQRAAIRRILCPTDFSDFSKGALARAVRLARWFRAEVTILHSIPFASPSVGASATSEEPPPMFLAESREEVEAAMRDLKATFISEGVVFQSVIVEGDPVFAIEACARELPADLVVIGTHGRGGFNRFLLGSTTERVVRSVPCPVLTVGRQPQAPDGLLFRRILCAVDLSPQSRHTAETALSVAEENLAAVTLLHVAPKPHEEWAPFPLVAGDNTQMEEALRAGASTELKRILETLQGHGVVSARVELGSPWREIVRAAEREASDLIVIGAHTDRSLGSLFVGSVAGQVVRHAPCPVLVVRGLDEPNQK